MNTHKAIVRKIKSGRNKNQFRFNLHGGNGKIICTSGSESYHNLQDAIGTIEKYFPNFTIILPVEDVRQRNHKEPVKAPDKATNDKRRAEIKKAVDEAYNRHIDEEEQKLRDSMTDEILN